MGPAPHMLLGLPAVIWLPRSRSDPDPDPDPLVAGACHEVWFPLAGWDLGVGRLSQADCMHACMLSGSSVQLSGLDQGLRDGHGGGGCGGVGQVERAHGGPAGGGHRDGWLVGATCGDHDTSRARVKRSRSA